MTPVILHLSSQGLLFSFTDTTVLASKHRHLSHPHTRRHLNSLLVEGVLAPDVFTPSFDDIDMSLPPLQVGADKSGKQRAAAMKEPVQQHPGEVYYGMGPPAVESGHGDSSAVVYNPDKGPQSHSHYQQAPPSVKWMSQESIQGPSGWPQDPPVSTWGQNFGSYMSGVNVRSQMAFHKGVHESMALPRGAEGQLGVAPPVEAYRDGPAQGRGLEWDQHPVTAMQQAYQHAHKGVEVQGQTHVGPHPLQSTMLQPFHATFRPSKQFSSSYYPPVFPGSKGVYGEQPKSQQQQQLLHQMQQQQQQQMHHQQQLHQQRQLQQLQQQQHIQQQQQQQMQLQQQMQQQYHHQHIQQQQHMQHMQQQLQHQNVTQQDGAQLQTQPKQQQQQQPQRNFAAYQSPEQCQPESTLSKKDAQQVQQQEMEQRVPNPLPDKAPANPPEVADAADAATAAPRRSRRLSRDGQSPLQPPSANIWPQDSRETPAGQNGVTAVAEGAALVTTGGVIQVTSRRRRASKEINLETLAQQASKMEPAKMVKVKYCVVTTL